MFACWLDKTGTTSYHLIFDSVNHVKQQQQQQQQQQSVGMMSNSQDASQDLLLYQQQPPGHMGQAQQELRPAGEMIDQGAKYGDDL